LSLQPDPAQLVLPSRHREVPGSLLSGPVVRIPPNCNFLVDDAEREWIFDENTFDLIHIRNLAQGISNWPNVISEATRCLKPGHYLELSELGVIFNSDDGTMTEETPAYRWTELLTEALSTAGRPALVKGMLEQRLKEAGYEDIHAFNLKLPFGPWAKEKRLKELGCLTLLGAESGFQAYGDHNTHGLRSCGRD
jgi:SAM-dependent methyltransferase